MTDSTSCQSCYTDEVKLENILLTHEDPGLFIKSQWPMGRCPFVTYRVSVAILFFVWVMTDFLEEARQFYSYNYAIWLIFATNWSFLLLAASNIFTAATAAYYYITSRRYEEETCFEKMPLILSLQWFVYNVAANSSMVVSISYWTFLIAIDNSAFLVTPMSRLKHTLNSVYVICDLMISATPVRIFHLVYPLLFGAFYSVFNALYFIKGFTGPNGHHYAYGVMDWRNPMESSVTCALVFMLSTLTQCILYEIYALRMWIYTKFVKRSGVAKPNPKQENEERVNILQRKDSIGTPDYHTVQPDVIEMDGRHETETPPHIPVTPQ